MLTEKSSSTIPSPIVFLSPAEPGFQTRLALSLVQIWELIHHTGLNQLTPFKDGCYASLMKILMSPRFILTLLPLPVPFLGQDENHSPELSSSWKNEKCHASLAPTSSSCAELDPFSDPGILYHQWVILLEGAEDGCDSSEAST